MSIQGGIALLWLALLLAGEAGLAVGWASPSRCTSIEQGSSGGQPRFTLYSHFGYTSGQSYSARADCGWQVDAPAPGSWWLITFEKIELESSSSVQRCKYDNLTVQYRFNNQAETRVVCGRHTNLVLVTNAAFQLSFQSDSSVNLRGFKVYWEAISESRATQMISGYQISPVFRSGGSTGSCSSIEHRGGQISFAGSRYNTTILTMSSRDGSYIHNADCSWFLQGSNPTHAVYIVFDQVQLEGDYSSPCALDNITVTYHLRRNPSSQRRVFCKLNRTIRLVSQNSALLNLRTDSSIGTGFKITWFAAPRHLEMPGLFETSRQFIEEQCPEIAHSHTGGSIRLYFYAPQTYEPGMSCSWTVQVPPRKAAEFRFYRFELARSRYRIGPSYSYYNLTRRINFCSTTDDSVTIVFRRFSPYGSSESSQFCANSRVQTGQTVVTAVGAVQISFRSHQNGRIRYRDGRGFVLGYRFIDGPGRGGRRSCPQPRQIDSYRSQIGVQPGESPNLEGANRCSWTLRPRDSQHLLSLTVNLAGQSQYPNSLYPPPIDMLSYEAHSPYSVPHLPYMPCQTLVYVTSFSRTTIALPAAATSGASGAANPTREVYCPPSINRPAGLFNGDVNVSISSLRPSLNLMGFNLSILNIPKPKQGCSVVNISTEYTNNRALKVFNISAQAGCVVAEFLKQTGFSQSYSNVMLKVTFELTCTRAGARGSLDIVSQLVVTSVPCNGSAFVYDSWAYPLVLKFPDSTDAKLISKVIYNFPVIESICQNLNSQTGGNGTFGNIHLPLFIDSGLLPASRSHYEQIACNFELSYRPGYSIVLRISHNLGFDDIDFYCHTKLSTRDISPHIVLTASQRDLGSPGTWVEQQLEMCHGYSIGSLGTRSEMLVDGSVSISLLALNNRRSTGGPSSLDERVLQDIFNQTQVVRLNFIISYEYVPSCPELRCQSLSRAQSGCQNIPVSRMKLEAQLARTPDTRTAECKWNIPTSSDMRRAMASQSDSWMARIELSNFVFGCPCHDCDIQEQHMTIGHKPADGSPATDKIIVCGDYRTVSRVLYMPLTASLTDIEIAYSAIETGINISVTFIDCNTNSSLRECRMARSQVWGVEQFLVGGRTPGGLVILAILLTVLLIGCLLYINREAVGSRVQAALQARQQLRSDDTLQLTHETAAQQE